MAEHPEAVAIIGLACRFPGARNADEFWRNLVAGVESIRPLSDAELLAAGVAPATLADAHYVKAAATIDGIDEFDARFFGYSPREAEYTDPQQRLFLECAWQALEDAGHDPERFGGVVGVYAGAGSSAYLLAAANSAQLRGVDYLELMVGNDKDQLTTRVSYKLNLTGPSYGVQTACSTSLVAVHLACDSLLNGQTDLALAGGISIRPPDRVGYFYREGGIASPDGHCRAFDARAQGTVFGHGVGLVVLRRLSDALASGDRIYAVIRGSSINNDGAAKVGYTAPSVEGQSKVIAEALALSGVTADTISYVETHGTATPLGDPIEIAALTRAFRASTERVGYCAIGSVKTNIGHLDTAAGVAGLIKTALALYHEQLPASLHFEQPNPEIDFITSPFYVNAERRAWPRGERPRRAGVSSFGIGGTNAHVVLEEAPSPPAAAPGRPWQLLVLSARSEAARSQAASALADHLEATPSTTLADVAFTLAVGRKQFGQRRIVVGHESAELVAQLRAAEPPGGLTGTAPASAPPVAFLFTGQGAQYVNMGRQLYECERRFRAAIDHCAERLQPRLGVDLRTILFPEPAAEAAAAEQLQQTWLTQPALFTLEFALARLWMSWGVQPDGMLGHSIGEFVAACLAGVMTLDEALELVAERGRLMQSLPAGAMLAVSAPAATLQERLTPELSLAAVNGPALSVVAGPSAAIATLQADLEGVAVRCRPLRTSHAFHSAMMEPIVAAFVERVRALKLQPPRRRYISNVTGDWITAEQATDPHYWGRHLREAVQFDGGLTTLVAAGPPVLLEIGPGTTLASLARAHPQAALAGAIVASLRRPTDTIGDQAQLLTSLGRLWLAGVAIDWPAVFAGEQRQRLSLPTYPFERQRYWLTGTPPGTELRPARQPDVKLPDQADWFYAPGWMPTPLPPAPAPPVTLQRWLIFEDTVGVAARLGQRLRAAGHSVVSVKAGHGYVRLSETAYQIDPDRGTDYAALLMELAAPGDEPLHIVHCWSLTATSPTPTGHYSFRSQQRLGYYSLLFLAHGLNDAGLGQPIALSVITNDLFDIAQAAAVCPDKITLLAPCLVMAQERPNVVSRCVEIVVPEQDRGRAMLSEQLHHELTTPADAALISYRGRQRWRRHYLPTPLPAAEPSRLRPGGVYLITGGLGRIGLTLARHLACTVGARLVLTARTDLMAREQWPDWLAAHGADDPLSQRIRAVQELEALGATVLVAQVDVADEEGMRLLVRRTVQQFGALNGVIHAAGILDATATGRLLHQTGLAESERQFHAKVHGLYVLERVLAGQPIDFCYLLSSSSAVLGGLGYGAYSAANLFLDAFATQRGAAGDGRWLSVNLDAVATPGDEAGPRRGLAALAMTPDEVVAVFERTLAAGVAQVVVSTGDLTARLDSWVQPRALAPLPAVDPGATSAAAPAVLGINDVERRLGQIWQRVLGASQIGRHDDFFELGGHSLLALQVFAEVEREFGVKLPLAALFQAPTIATLADLIGESETITAAWSSLVPVVVAGDRPRFFCVHGGGGNVLQFHALAEHLGDDQPFYALQAQGLDGRHTLHDRVEDMAVHYLKEVQAVQPHGPYHLGGYCLGGLVAWEMAHRLQQAGETVALLALFETYYPRHTSSPEYQRHWLRERLKLHLAQLRARSLGEQIRYARRPLQTMAWRVREALQTRTWRSQFVQARAAEEPIPPELREFVQLARLAEDRYMPPHLTGRPLLFIARERGVGHDLDPLFGWGGMSSDKIEVYEVPGNHATIWSEPYVRVMAHRLKQALDVRAPGED